MTSATLGGGSRAPPLQAFFSRGEEGSLLGPRGCGAALGKWAGLLGQGGRMGTSLRARALWACWHAARAVESCLVHGTDALVINGGLGSSRRALERAHERGEGAPREHAGGGLRGGESRAKPLLVRRVLDLPCLGYMGLQVGRHGVAGWRGRGYGRGCTW